MMSEGSWSISSKTDPRWDDHGSGSVGMFEIPPDAKIAIEEKKKLYGEPPDDLEYEYMKY